MDIEDVRFESVQNLFLPDENWQKKVSEIGIFYCRY